MKINPENHEVGENLKSEKEKSAKTGKPWESEESNRSRIACKTG